MALCGNDEGGSGGRADRDAPPARGVQDDAGEDGQEGCAGHRAVDAAWLLQIGVRTLAERYFLPLRAGLLSNPPPPAIPAERPGPFPTRPPGAEASRDPAAQIHIQADIRTTLVVFWTVEAPSSPVNPTSEPQTGSEHYTMPSGLRFAVYCRETSFLLPVRSIILASWQLIVRRVCVVRALSSKPSKLGLRQPRWVQSRKIARKAARPI